MILNEIGNLSRLSHPNIIKMYEYFEDAEYYHIITDIYKGGDLFDEIASRGKLGENDAKMLMKQILNALDYCHKNHIIHGDIKPENVMMEQSKKFD